MRLTTRGRYAVTAMLDLALHGDQAPVSLADIAARQDISLAYLEQILARLRRRGLAAISVAAIIDAVDESLDATRCGGAGDCQQGERCLTHDLWADLSREVHQYLDGVSLAALVERAGIREVATRQDGRVRPTTARIVARQI